MVSSEVVKDYPTTMSSDVELLTDQFPSPATIKHDIEENGYMIYENSISLSHTEQMRKFWIEYFNKNKRPARKALRGDFLLGDNNFISYSNDKMWHIYRDFDFLWNAPTHTLTRDLCVQIHKKRNLAQNFSEDYGLLFHPDRYGTYISTSYYPVGTGFLYRHSDGHKETPILQFMVNFTYKGIDYESGGIYLYDKGGNKINVEEKMAPGSIVFFDGRLDHGVDPVSSKNGHGRISTFAIPTFFNVQDDLPAFLRSLDRQYFIFRRIRQAAMKRLLKQDGSSKAHTNY